MSQITVRVGKLPGRIVPVSLPEGATVKDAIAAAELKTKIDPADLGAENASSYEVRVNAEAGDSDTELNEGDNVLLVKKLKGN